MTMLKEIRTANRYKLRDIAEVAGVSIQAVHQWEIGTTKPPIDKLVKVARFYGVTVDELLADPEVEDGTETKDAAAAG